MSTRWQGRYEPLEIVGSGGQGEVWRARDHMHDRLVALKVRPAGSKAAREHLLAEARTLLSLRPHENLPLVREDFFVGRRYVIAMDWVEGMSLRRVLDEQGEPGLSPSLVAGWLGQVGGALEHLHSHEPAVVHGDVKPSNCVLSRQGRVVLVDFGLSARAGRGVRGAGTAGYVAPEVAGGRPATTAADVFGLAATAIALLTGAPPSVGAPRWHGVAPMTAAALERAIRRGLSVDPAGRPRAGELVDRIRTALSSDLPTGIVTFLLTDVPGSAERWDLDPEAMTSALARQDQLIAAAADAHGGRLVRTQGESDATVSVFSSAVEAVAAALSLQRELRAAAPSVPLPVRVGLNTGEAILRSGTYTGPSLARAAQVRDLAGAAGVAMTRATADVVADRLPRDASLAALGRHPLGSGSEPVFALAHPDLPVIEAPTVRLREQPRLRHPRALAAAIGAVIALGVAGVVLLRLDRVPQPAATVASIVPSDGHPMLYESERDGLRQIWVMDLTTRRSRRLTSDPIVWSYLPKPSPDGRSILFVREGSFGIDLFLMDARGGSIRRLTSNPGLDTTPAWSPDGREIAFVSNRGQGNLIYVITVARGERELRQVTSVISGRPSWSPDGLSLAFHSAHADGRGDVFVADARLTRQTGRRVTFTDANEAEPAWSPDGRTIAYVRQTKAGSDLMILDVARPRTTRVLAHLPTICLQPDWRADGRFLALACGPHDRDNDIFVVPYAARGTTEPIRLTDTPGVDDQNPSW